MSEWVNVRERLPAESGDVLCVLEMSCQGEYAPWQQVCHYDRLNKTWMTVTASPEPVSEWHFVTWWKPLDWPPSS